MRLFKEKLAWAAPIAVILIIALFSVNLFVQGDPKPANLPVALVINDEGEHVEAVKLAADKMSTGVNGEEPVIAFTNESEENIEELFHNKVYYAALVVPEGYNDALHNSVANNSAATLQIYVNQGYNMTGANFAKTALESLVSQISTQYSKGFISHIGDEKISANQASVLVSPIVSEVKIFNEVTAATANGSAPILMAMPAWVGALIGGFILFLVTSSIHKKEVLNPKQKLHLMMNQIIFGVIIALFSGFTVATLGSMAGVNMPSYFLVGAFVSFAAFCFFLLVSAVTAWIGKPAITLFMVVMLLGMGVIMMPKEMIPDFFVTYVRPWIPIRFAGEGLREIFYFGSGFYTGQSFNIILSIGVGGLIIFLLSVFKPVRKNVAAE